eukprot:8182383-Lingulodinium_polyedra.AAC.1
MEKAGGKQHAAWSVAATWSRDPSQKDLDNWAEPPQTFDMRTMPPIGAMQSRLEDKESPLG